MTTTVFTDGVTLTAASWFNDVDTESYKHLTGVAGTNTITATGPASLTAHTTGRGFTFVPAVTNTGATTINPTCNSVALGAKNIFWNGVACVGDEIRAGIPCWIIYDGTQYHITASGFNPPFLDTHPVVVGGTDRTKKVRVEADGITTGTTRVWTARDADFEIGAATQAEQETGTSLVASVTPGRQQFHPSAAKGWVQADAAAGATSSYNVSSVGDTGAGHATINWATDFSTANYCVVYTARIDPGGSQATTYVSLVRNTNFAAGTTDVLCIKVSDGSLADPTYHQVVAFGDQ